MTQHLGAPVNNLKKLPTTNASIMRPRVFFQDNLLDITLIRGVNVSMFVNISLYPRGCVTSRCLLIIAYILLPVIKKTTPGKIFLVSTFLNDLFSIQNFTMANFASIDL